MTPVNTPRETAPTTPATVPSGAAGAINVGRLGELAGVPLYELVKRHVSEAILFGHWPPGTLLPSEVALAQNFGVAVGTVRRALANLTAEGLLARRRKTGTVVTGRSPHHSLRSFFQYFRLHGLDGSLVRSHAKVIRVERDAGTPIERRLLELRDGVEVLRLHRVRGVGGIPIMHDRMVASADRLPGFPDTPGAVPELIYLHLLERYGIRISAVREQLSAGLADDADLKLLDLKPPAAVLIIDEVAFDQAGAPTILSSHRARTDRHCYVNEVQ
ncbi:MAG: GntR family transcriptional regulator [Proteobacteria bacterium]|nr:GntR family transcriptional regulator [Pseudomonadota bacterium]